MGWALMRKVKEIRSRAGVLHFVRFAVFETPWLSLYVHRIHAADADPHLHSHPWPFATVVLSGTYVEKAEAGRFRRGPLSVRAAGVGYFHKIERVVEGPVTTVLLAGRRREDWYYLVDGERVRFDEYRREKHGA